MPYDGILYHYTTSRGLEGILRDRAIFATHSDYLNDISEYHHGRKLILRHLSDSAVRAYFGKPRDGTSIFARLEKPPVEEGELRSLMSGIMSYIWHRFQQNPPFASYVTSFCKKGNLLSQWRGYGGAGGYSIGFRFPTKEVRYENNRKRGAILHGLLYKPAEQRALLDIVLPALEEVITLIRPVQGFSQDVRRDPLIEDLVDRLSRCLEVCCLRMKHSSFRSEQEMRLTTTRTPEGDGFDNDDLNFRQVDGVNIPYVNIPIRDEYAKVVSVRCGPTLPKRKAVKAVEMMLKQYGYEEVEVKSSAIPLSW